MSDTLHFRRIRPQEGELYARFVHDFYASDGVDHPIPAEYIQRAFAEICRGDDYLICYILEENGDPAGYALLAKMYAQEAGGMAIWLDEFYLDPAFRGRGIGAAFLQWLRQEWEPQVARFRLEVVPSHDRVKAMYARAGFLKMPYDQMVLETPLERENS